MAEPWDNRSRYRILGLVGAVLLTFCTVDLGTSDLHPAVWMFVVAWFLGLAALGIRNGALVSVGRLVPSMSRRFTLGVAAVTLGSLAVMALSRVLGGERTAFDQVVAVLAGGLAAGMVGTSVTVLRRLPTTGSDGSAYGGS